MKVDKDGDEAKLFLLYVAKKVVELYENEMDGEKITHSSL